MTSIPQGSTILVTGGTGFIGSHVVDQALKAGYRVRVPVRSPEKGSALTTYFGKQYGADKIETVTVKDMNKEDAYDEAVKGVSGVVHLASTLTFSDSYEDVVHTSVAGALAALKGASKEHSVKSFVLTSSSGASGLPPSVKEAHEKSNGWNVYYASKVEAEKAALAFVEKEKPGFKFNVILPNANFGRIFPGLGASTGSWITTTVEGKPESLNTTPPQWFINVRDTALLHLIALTSPQVTNERIWAVSAPYTWNEVLGHLRHIAPQAPIPADLTGEKDAYDHTTIDFEHAKELLKPYGGITDLETTLKEAVEGMKAQ